MAITNAKALEVSDRLYERYLKAMEPTHYGQYVAIQPDGRFVAGADMMDVIQDAKTKLGVGFHLLKVGERAVFRWR